MRVRLTRLHLHRLGGAGADDAQGRVVAHQAGHVPLTLANALHLDCYGVHPLLEPALFVPYGLTETPGPLSDAFVIWTEEPAPLPPESNATNDQRNEAHERLRRRDAVVEQIGTFLETGEIVHTCDGPCNCAQGACGEIDPVGTHAAHGHSHH